LLDIRRRGVLYTLVGVLASAAFAGTDPAAHSDRRASPVVVAYYVDADQESFTTLLTHGHRISWVITTNFILVDPTGRLDGVHDPGIVEVMHHRGSKVQFRVANFVRGDWSRAVAHGVLTQPRARDRAVARILRVLDEYGYDGVSLDLENVSPKDRAALSSFVAEVSAKVHARGKTVTIAVPGKTQDWRDSNWAGAFDLAALGRACDAVIVMAYDQHWSTSAPGPVAALPWVEEVARFAAREVGPHKVLLGLAFYGYDWPRRGPGVGVSMREAVNRAARLGAQIRWDPSAHVPYFKTRTRTVYFEDARSIEHKLGLAVRHGLGGIAAWRLGQELPQVWDAVGAYVGSLPAALPASP
jgi:spore germination protein YaaH